MRALVLVPAFLFVATTVHAQQGPSWTGRDIAATAQPLTVVDPAASARQRGERIVPREPGRDIGYRPPRSIYVDPYGNVTSFVGAPPAWIAPQYYDNRGYTPSERQFYGQSSPSVQQPQGSPCTTNGPATASSAIAQAANGSGC